MNYLTTQSKLSDLELIEKVKKDNDSSALTELINRHSGIYMDMASNFSRHYSVINLNEIRDDKALNIYKWILSYNPDKNTKLSTYIGNMTKFMCKKMLSSSHEMVNIDNIVSTDDEKNISSLSNTTEQIDKSDNLEQIKDISQNIDDKRFWEIMRLRYFSGGKINTWRYIGKQMCLSHEYVRIIHNKYINNIKHNL